MRTPSPHGFNRLIVTSLLLAACSAGGRDATTVRPLATIRLPAAHTATPVAVPTSTPWLAPLVTMEPRAAPQGPLTPGTPLTVTEIDMMDGSSGWGFGLAAGDGASRVLRTSDGGATWQDVTPPKTSPPVEFGQDPTRPEYQRAVGFFPDRRTAWIVYDEYPFGPQNYVVNKIPVVVWHTVDGGQSWSSSSPLALDTTGWDHEPWANTFYPIGLQFLEDSLTGWLLAITQSDGMGCCDKVLFRTEDGGKTWRSISAPCCGEGNMVFADANRGWITASHEPGFSGYLANLTEDGGHSWTDVEGLTTRAPGPHVCFAHPYGDPARCETYDPTRLSTGWVQLLGWISGGDYVAIDQSADYSKDLLAVYSSNDGGLTWRWALLPSSSPPAPSFLEDYSGVDVFFLTERIGWVLDYLSGKLYRTLDAGGSWEEIKSVTWNGRLEFAGEIYGWAVAWGGDNPSEQPYPPSPVEMPEAYGLVRTFDGGSTWILLEPKVAVH